MTGVVQAQGVTRILPGAVSTVLVRDIDMEVAEGEFVAVTGPSGSGKSSLLYLLGLLDAPSQGRILFDGRDTSSLSAADLAGLRLRRIGFVFQFHFLLPEFTAAANVMLPMRQLGDLDDGAIAARAERLLADFGLADQAGKRPDQMSGGQRQRVALARALANDPQLILADEPTGNLDTRSSRMVFDVLVRLVEEGRKTVVVVTHNLELASLAARQIRVVDGRIVADSGARS